MIRLPLRQRLRALFSLTREEKATLLEDAEAHAEKLEALHAILDRLQLEELLLATMHPQRAAAKRARAEAEWDAAMTAPKAEP